jgi:hypothetical protein
MTLKEWRQQPDIVAEYSKALSSPAIQTALQVLLLEFLPKGIIPGNAPNLLERGAILNARREGYYDFYRNLLGLAEAKPEIDIPEQQPWSYKRNEL